MVLPALGGGRFEPARPGFFLLSAAASVGESCCVCRRGRGEKKTGPAATLGPRRQRLHANSADGSEGLLLSAPLRVVASALQTLK